MTATGLPPAEPPIEPALEVTLDPLGAAGDGHAHLLRGSAYSLATICAGALTSALFWLIAARLYPTEAVGHSAGLFTSLLFVTFAGNLGIPVAIAHFGAQPPHSYDVLITWALGAAAAAAAIAGVLFVVAVPSETTGALREWGLGPAVVVFAALAACTALAIALDIRLMVARRWAWVLVRVAAVGLLRLPLLWLAPVGSDAFWIFLLAALPPALSGVLGVAALPRLTGDHLRVGPRPPVMSEAIRYSAVNYLASLASDAARFALPVLVLLHVTARANASFYVAWGVTLVAFLVPTTIGQVLLAEAPKAVERAAAQMLVALGLAAGLMLAATLVAWSFADVIVSLYGSGYREAARILPALMAAGVPWAVASICLADARIRRDSRATLLITLTLGLGVLGPALVLVPDRGVDGATTAWLGGNLAAAAVGAGVTVAHRRRTARS